MGAEVTAARTFFRAISAIRLTSGEVLSLEYGRLSFWALKSYAGSFNVLDMSGAHSSTWSEPSH